MGFLNFNLAFLGALAALHRGLSHFYNGFLLFHDTDEV